jgi:hypothetical protein
VLSAFPYRPPRKSIQVNISARLRQRGKGGVYLTRALEGKSQETAPARTSAVLECGDGSTVGNIDNSIRNDRRKARNAARD